MDGPRRYAANGQRQNGRRSRKMVGHRPVSPLNVIVEISRFGTCIANYNPSAVFLYFWCTKIQNKKCTSELVIKNYFRKVIIEYLLLDTDSYQVVTT